MCCDIVDTYWGEHSGDLLQYPHIDNIDASAEITVFSFGIWRLIVTIRSLITVQMT